MDAKRPFALAAGKQVDLAMNPLELLYSLRVSNRDHVVGRAGSNQLDKNRYTTHRRCHTSRISPIHFDVFGTQFGLSVDCLLATKRTSLFCLDMNILDGLWHIPILLLLEVNSRWHGG